MTRSHAAWLTPQTPAPQHGKGVCAMGHTLSPLPSPAPPCGHGRSSNPRLFHPSGRGGQSAASTHHGALPALVFLSRHVLTQPFPALADLEHAKKSQRVPVVFARQDVPKVLAHLTGIPPLMASLLSGSGLRLMACVRLRVKDVDCAYHHLTVRDPQGAHDRVTRLLQSLKALHRQPPAFQNRPSRGPRAREPLRTSPSPMQCGLDRPRCASRRQADARAATIVPEG